MPVQLPGMNGCDSLQGSKSFFSEIISSVSDMKWSSDGRYILARDYMNLKLWDLNMESAPVATYSVHEHLRAKASLGQSCQHVVIVAVHISKGTLLESLSLHEYLAVEVCSNLGILYPSLSCLLLRPVKCD